MLVMIAGTMTMASARAGGIDTASRPIDTVGRPSPIAPLMKPASKNDAAIRSRRWSNMQVTLTGRRNQHNLQVIEPAFGHDEGSLSFRAMRSIELRCALAHRRISRFPDAQLRICGLVLTDHPGMTGHAPHRPIASDGRGR